MFRTDISLLLAGVSSWLLLFLVGGHIYSRGNIFPPTETLADPEWIGTWLFMAIVILLPAVTGIDLIIHGIRRLRKRH